MRPPSSRSPPLTSFRSSSMHLHRRLALHVAANTLAQLVETCVMSVRRSVVLPCVFWQTSTCVGGSSANRSPQTQRSGGDCCSGRLRWWRAAVRISRSESSCAGSRGTVDSHRDAWSAEHDATRTRSDGSCANTDGVAASRSTSLLPLLLLLLPPTS